MRFDRVIADKMMICGAHFSFLALACSPRTAMPTPSRQSSDPDHTQRTHMKTLQSILASTALVVGLGLAPALLPAPAFAVDNMSSTDAPDLTSVRAKIKAQDYAAALRKLRDLAEDVQQADGVSAQGVVAPGAVGDTH